MLLLALLLTSIIVCCHAQQKQSRFPLEITLRAAVLHAPPFATVEEQADGTVVYGGFQADMLKRLQVFAQADNVTLNFNLSVAPPQYGPALDLAANDCEEVVENPDQDCGRLDLIVGNYYATPDRALRVDLSPAWLRSTISTVKFVDKNESSTDYTTLTQAEEAGAVVCLKDGTFYSGVVKAKFPNIPFLMCSTEEYCVTKLQEEACVLYASDELQLRYKAAWDPSLEVTREQFNTQYIVWPMSFDLDPIVALLMNRWIFAAVTNATLDELYFKYFQKALCPIGTAGEACELRCDPDHGQADARGVCVCLSTKWTGDDCSIEVPENANMIPIVLRILAYGMFAINVITIMACGAWLIWKRSSTQVRVSQPFFLNLVLLGCLISSSTIIVLAEEDEGDGPVHACMAIPWLYSVGFCITFGTLFAKIRRVYILFKSAVDMRRISVSMRETLIVIGTVLLVDVAILVIWTSVDPLEWQRTVTRETQLSEPLESEGHCTSEHWGAFAGIIALFHLILLGIACYLCYVARGIPTKFSEGKYVSVAMISNLQIFVVGVPILFVLGTDSQTSFFVRSVIVWMNDFVVVTLIFGNLMYSVHFGSNQDNDQNIRTVVGDAIQHYSSRMKISSRHLDSSRHLEQSVEMSNDSFRNFNASQDVAALPSPPRRFGKSVSGILRSEYEEERVPSVVKEVSEGGIDTSRASRDTEIDRGSLDIDVDDVIRGDKLPRDTPLEKVIEGTGSTVSYGPGDSSMSVVSSEESGTAKDIDAVKSPQTATKEETCNDVLSATQQSNTPQHATPLAESNRVELESPVLEERSLPKAPSKVDYSQGSGGTEKTLGTSLEDKEEHIARTGDTSVVEPPKRCARSVEQQVMHLPSIGL